MSKTKEQILLDKIKRKGYTNAQIEALMRYMDNPKPLTQQKHHHFKTNEDITFALVGDTHIGSKFHDNDSLQIFYDEAIKRGVKTFYQVGDLIDGENMWKGHVYQIVAHGLDEQVKLLEQLYPKREGVETYFINGNHDDAFMKSAGVNPGELIASTRQDMHYLGDREATIGLGAKGKTKMTLLHPGGGTAYALSYRPQKIIESLEGGTKPHLLAIGHYHKLEQLFYRNVHCFQAGTHESQTDFMKEKAISAHKGGWIIKLKVGSDGTINALNTELISFYR